MPIFKLPDGKRINAPSLDALKKYLSNIRKQQEETMAPEHPREESPNDVAKWAIGVTMQLEGGYVKHPLDGETKFGISSVAFPNLDIKGLTAERAKQIYYDKYWPHELAGEASPQLLAAIFDFSVHSGKAQAVKIMQKVLGVTPDGKIGPKTLRAIQQKDSKELVQALNGRRLLFLKSLVTTNPKRYGDFAKGWENRMVKLNNILYPPDTEQEVSAAKPDVKVGEQVKDEHGIVYTVASIPGSTSEANKK